MPRLNPDCTPLNGTDAIDTSGGSVTFTLANNTPLTVTFQNAYRFTMESAGCAALNDMALIQIPTAQRIPKATLTPAKMSLRYPTNGEMVTVVGYGCSDRNNPCGGGGVKRYATVPWPTNVASSGDSGGSLFLSDGTRGGVTDACCDQFGDLVDKKWEVEAMIRQIDGNFEYGIDRAGNDYNNFASSSAAACKTSCDKDAACRAFSYQIAERHCWLKNGVMAASFNDDNIAGVPDEWIAGVDPIGGDISNFVGTDLNVCHATCSNTVSPTRCVAWVVDTSTGRFYLKSAVNSLSTVAASTLGILRTPEQNTNRAGGDLVHFAGSNVTDCTVRCANNAQCMAWTLASGTCYLKSVVPDAVTASGMQSGFRQGLVFFADYRGDDLSSFTFPGCPVSGDPMCAGNNSPLLRPQVCQQACQTTSGCKAWTMDISSDTCYLKNGIPPLASSINHVSVTGTNTTALDW